MGDTMSVSELHAYLAGIMSTGHGDKPVRLICAAISYPAPDVWFMPHAGADGEVCIGDDPR